MIDFARRHVLRKREDFRVHDAAGGLLVVFEQVADFVARAFLDQLEDGGRQRFGQVVDDRRGVVRRQVVQQAGDLFGRPIGEERRAPFGPELAERLHRELAVALDEERERGVAILLAELGEDLREVGGMLLVQQVDEIRRRADANQALDRIEDDVNLALRHERSAQSTMRLSGSFSAKCSSARVLSASARGFDHPADAGVLHGVVGRHHEERPIGLGADDVLRR